MKLDKKELSDLSTLTLTKMFDEKNRLIELYDREHKNKIQFLEQLDQAIRYIRLHEKITSMEKECE